jgi:hypothetical protein
MVSLMRRVNLNPRLKLRRSGLLARPDLLALRAPLAPVDRVLAKEVSGPWLRRVVIRSPCRIGLLLVVADVEDLLALLLPSRIHKYINY